MNSIKYVDASLLEAQYLERGQNSFQGERYEALTPKKLIEEYAKEVGVDKMPAIELEPLKKRDFDNWDHYKQALEEVKRTAFLEVAEND